MKNSIILVAFLALFVCSCGRTARVDVKTVSSVDSTRNWEVNIQRSVFFSEEAVTEKSCSVLNSRISHFIDSMANGLKQDADQFFAEYRHTEEEYPAFGYELYVRDTVFMANDKYISVRLTIYEFEGGAHGMTNYYAFNYDVKNQRFFQPDQILDLNKKSELNALLKKNFVNKDGCFTEIPTLSNGYTAVNVSPTDVYFIYPQYVLGPYSCGAAQVIIPRLELKDIYLWK